MTRARVEKTNILKLEFTYADSDDLAAELGAEKAPDESYKHVRNTILVALITAMWEQPESWTAYSRDRNRYQPIRRIYGPDFTFASMCWTVASLVRAELIEEQRTRPSAKAKYASRIRATPRLQQDCPVNHVSQLASLPVEPIILKDRNRRAVGYCESPTTRRMRSDANDQNDILSSITVSLLTPNWRMDHHGLISDGVRSLNPARCRMRRIFNWDFGHGGRWFDPWWQTVPSSDRIHLKIDGQDTLEIDYPRFHPTLLSAVAGIDLGTCDPYEIAGLERSECKLAFNVLLNATSNRSAISGIRDELRRQSHPSPVERAKCLVNAVEQHHHRFQEFWYKGLGLRLQRIDSAICAEVQEILRTQNTPTLSIHDSFIVDAAYEDRLHEAMSAAGERAESRLRKFGLSETIKILKL